jgi:hypothetical protein
MAGFSVICSLVFQNTLVSWDSDALEFPPLLMNEGRVPLQNRIVIDIQMGLFSTSLSIYKKDQPDIVDALKKELKEKRKLATFDRILVNGDNFQEILDSRVYSNPGVFYLVADRSNNWTSILELNVSLDDPFYLYEIANGMSLRLKTYCHFICTMTM